MWARTALKDATAPDPVAKPDNADLVRSVLSSGKILVH